MKIKGDTIIRTTLLAFALVNQVFTVLGWPIINLENAAIEAFITNGLTIASAIWAWWKNNSFSQEALAADNHLASLRGKN